MKRLFVILCLVFILAPIAPAHAAPRGWMITPVYAPIGYAEIINGEYAPFGGVVHLAGTTWVNDGWGRVVIAGHNPGMFAPLVDLDIGAKVIILGDGAVHEYRVTERVITTNDTRWLMPTNTPMLTLITCLERGNTWLILNAEEVYHATQTK